MAKAQKNRERAAKIRAKNGIAMPAGGVAPVTYTTTAPVTTTTTVL